MPLLAIELLEEREDLVAGARVEVAGRLVGEEERRLGDERARDGDALLLPAGELVRRVMHALGEADRASARMRALAPLAARDAAVDERQLHVLERGGARQQVEALEDEADEAVAHDGARVVRPRRRRRARRARSGRASGRSRQPRMFISVLLPEPLVPTMATNSPRAMVEIDAAERAHHDRARTT